MPTDTPPRTDAVGLIAFFLWIMLAPIAILTLYAALSYMAKPLWLDQPPAHGRAEPGKGPNDVR